MSNLSNTIKIRWKNGALYRLFNCRTEQGLGRFCIMLSGLVTSIVGAMSGGVFLTSFLLIYGLDKSRIGILTFIPYMACLLNIFSPALLERFPKRRWILISMKLLYYAINILAVTVLPSLIKGRNGLVIGFVILVLISNIINQLASSGWSAWQVPFLPEEIRVDFFQVTTCIQAASGGIVSLIISFVGDRLAGTEHELVMLTVIRYAAFIIALVDCAIWLLPKEYPYKKSAKTKLSNIFLLPLKQKKFLMIVLLLAFYNFAVNLPNATLTAYLLQDAGVSYSLFNGISFAYFPFFLVFSKMWKRFIEKHYWYKAFVYIMLWYALSTFLYAFVTANNLWLYLLIRIGQHIIGVGLPAVTGSLIYVGLPQEDSTNYLSFYTIITNLAAFLSLMLGTFAAMIMGDNRIVLLGFGFSSTQLCLLATAVGSVLTAYLSFRLSKKYADDSFANKT